MDLDQPGESESLDENSKYDHDQSVPEFSGLANQFNFFIDTSSRYKKIKSQKMQ